MHQIQFWAAIASLLTVFPAHALSPSSTVESGWGGASTNANSEGKVIRLGEILAQETPEPEVPADVETPAEPEVPADVETPAEPEVPGGDVETPAEPEVPADVETPAEPEVPAEIETPAEPEATPSPNAEETTEPSDVILNEQGELNEGDSVLASDGSLYDEYTFEGTEGQEVTISLDSSEFDTYLAIFTPDNQLLEEHDDINQNNSNSQITVTLPSDGTYRVIVNSYDDKGRGKYNLTVR